MLPIGGSGDVIDRMIKEGSCTPYSQNGVPMIAFVETVCGSKEANMDVATVQKVTHIHLFNSVQTLHGYTDA